MTSEQREEQRKRNNDRQRAYREIRMKQSEDQINNQNARSDLMTTKVIAVEQQINQNV